MIKNTYLSGTIRVAAQDSCEGQLEFALYWRCVHIGKIVASRTKEFEPGVFIINTAYSNLINIHNICELIQEITQKDSI